MKAYMMKVDTLTVETEVKGKVLVGRKQGVYNNIFDAESNTVQMAPTMEMLSGLRPVGVECALSLGKPLVLEDWALAQGVEDAANQKPMVYLHVPYYGQFALECIGPEEYETLVFNGKEYSPLQEGGAKVFRFDLKQRYNYIEAKCGVIVLVVTPYAEIDWQPSIAGLSEQPVPVEMLDRERYGGVDLVYAPESTPLEFIVPKEYEDVPLFCSLTTPPDGETLFVTTGSALRELPCMEQGLHRLRVWPYHYSEGLPYVWEVNYEYGHVVEGLAYAKPTLFIGSNTVLLAFASDEARFIKEIEGFEPITEVTTTEGHKVIYQGQRSDLIPKFIDIVDVFGVSHSVIPNISNSYEDGISGLPQILQTNASVNSLYTLHLVGVYNKQTYTLPSENEKVNLSQASVKGGFYDVTVITDGNNKYPLGTVFVLEPNFRCKFNTKYGTTLERLKNNCVKVGNLYVSKMDEYENPSEIGTVYWRPLEGRKELVTRKDRNDTSHPLSQEVVREEPPIPVKTEPLKKQYAPIRLLNPVCAKSANKLGLGVELGELDVELRTMPVSEGQSLLRVTPAPDGFEALQFDPETTKVVNQIYVYNIQSACLIDPHLSTLLNIPIQGKLVRRLVEAIPRKELDLQVSYNHGKVTLENNTLTWEREAHPLAELELSVPYSFVGKAPKHIPWEEGEYTLNMLDKETASVQATLKVVVKAPKPVPTVLYKMSVDEKLTVVSCPNPALSISINGKVNKLFALADGLLPVSIGTVTVNPPEEERVKCLEVGSTVEGEYWVVNDKDLVVWAENPEIAEDTRGLIKESAVEGVIVHVQTQVQPYSLKKVTGDDFEAYLVCKGFKCTEFLFPNEGEEIEVRLMLRHKDYGVLSAVEASYQGHPLVLSEEGNYLKCRIAWNGIFGKVEVRLGKESWSIPTV